MQKAMMLCGIFYDFAGMPDVFIFIGSAGNLGLYRHGERVIWAMEETIRWLKRIA